MRIKVLSFNIRSMDDGEENTIRQRAPRLAIVISRYNPDIIGFQEFTPSWEEYIDKYYLDEYAFFNKYRTDIGWIESAPIMWKKDRFDCIKQGYFWLSDTPTIMSGGWDALGHNRICLYVLLKDKRSGKIFVYLNTHFGFGEDNQIKSVKLIHRYMDEMGKYPIFITGDFNMVPSSKPYSEMIKEVLDVNDRTIKDKSSTYHGYHPQQNLDAHIDYCFVSKNIVPIAFKIIKDLVDNKFPSDHYGIYAELQC